MESVRPFPFPLSTHKLVVWTNCLIVVKGKAKQIEDEEDEEAELEKLRAEMAMS